MEGAKARACIPDSGDEQALEAAHTMSQPQGRCRAYPCVSPLSPLPRIPLSQDAADFAIVFQCGNDNQMYPPSVPFTVVSGDQGFQQVQESCRDRGREFHIVNPHDTANDDNMVVGLLRSIAEQSLRRRSG